MKPDPIMEEIRRHRDEYAARFDYDVTAMLEDMGRRAAEWDESRKAVPTKADGAIQPGAGPRADRAGDAA